MPSRHLTLTCLRFVEILCHSFCLAESFRLTPHLAWKWKQKNCKMPSGYITSMWMTRKFHFRWTGLSEGIDWRITCPVGAFNPPKQLRCIYKKRAKNGVKAGKKEGHVEGKVEAREVKIRAPDEKFVLSLYNFLWVREYKNVVKYISCFISAKVPKLLFFSSLIFYFAKKL